MTDAPPILLRYDGDGIFSPRSPHWARVADKHYVIGQVYPIVLHEERSHATHAHFFVSVADAWSNLPDEIAQRFPTAEHLRKYALIKSGFCDTHTLVCGSKSEAQKVAQFMRPTDEFAVIAVQGSTVTRYTALSQSRRAMDKEKFQASKEAVLAVISGMIGTTSKALEDNSGKSGDGTI